jgi:competence protein ComEA
MDELLARIKSFIKQPGPSRRLAMLLFGLVAVIALVINSLGGEPSSAISSPTQSSSVSGDAQVNSPTFFVHVVGRVKTPGVYSLDVGSRLFDAIVIAGGFLPDADQASVNLARQLTDGEQITVLKIGEQANSSGVAAGSGIISINRANEAELETLPGVGPALAGRIIEWRTANGGFKQKEDLLQVGGIGDKLFAGLVKLITL